MARTVLCLHADESVRPTLVGEGHPKWAAVEVIGAGATTVEINDVPSVRVGVLVTVNQDIIGRNAAGIPMSQEIAIAIVRTAIDEIADMMRAQFGEETVEAALSEMVDVERDEPDTIIH